MTLKRYGKVTQWFSDHWPVDLEWPSEILRPVPSADSPAAKALAEARQANPLTGLNANGHIADVKGFCWRLNAQRSQFDQVIRQYGAGGTRAGEARLGIFGEP